MKLTNQKLALLGLVLPDWDVENRESVTIDTARHRVRAAVDGEPVTLETPIEFRVDPRALRVLVPAEVGSGGRDEEEPMDTPEPTEAEHELEGTERHEQEDAMRGPDTQRDEPQETTTLQDRLGRASVYVVDTSSRAVTALDAADAQICR